MFKPSIWSRFWNFRALNEQYQGNLKGEGRLLGGVLVIGPGETGVVYDYREKEFGDHAPVEEVVAAVKKMKGQ